MASVVDTVDEGGDVKVGTSGEERRRPFSAQYWISSPRALAKGVTD